MACSLRLRLARLAEQCSTVAGALALCTPTRMSCFHCDEIDPNALSVKNLTWGKRPARRTRICLSAIS
eukprot:5282344-Pyramimonas_sp.AAC.1